MAKKIVHLAATTPENPLASELKVGTDGRGSVTFRGVARICGLSHRALANSGSRAGEIFSAKLTEKLVASGFQMETFQEWKKSGIPDVAVAVIVEHYAFDAGERSTKEALIAFRSFGAIGVRAWIQKELGWKPPSEVQRFVDNHVLREPRSWEVVFDKQWIRAAEQCTGWKWSEQCMSRAINLTVYDRLPKEVRQVLDEYNPITSTGRRQRKQHQHFSQESVEQVLKMQIEIGRSLLMVSTSWAELKENTARRFEGMAQLKLLC